MCLSLVDAKKYLKKYPKLYLKLSKGDCLIHNPHVLHGSDDDKSQYDRKAFNFSLSNQNSQRKVVPKLFAKTS